MEMLGRASRLACRRDWTRSFIWNLRRGPRGRAPRGGRPPLRPGSKTGSGRWAAGRRRPASGPWPRRRCGRAGRTPGRIARLSTPVWRRWASGSISLRSYSTRSASPATARTVSQWAWPQVSTAVWRPRSRANRRHSSRKSSWAKGSPPEKVTPPPEVSKNARSRSARATSSSGQKVRPMAVRAPEGQASAQAAHSVHSGGGGQVGADAPAGWTGQARTHSPQPRQRSGASASSKRGFSVSGL